MDPQTPILVNTQLMPYMKPIIEHRSRFQVLNWHRKARKTTLGLYNLIRWAYTTPYPFWYISPSYGLAKKTIWDDPMMLAQMLGESWNTYDNPFFKKNETESTIKFKESGGMIYLIGADRPDLMRGPNPRGVVIDEAAYVKEQVWQDVVQPIMVLNPDAWTWFLFTPNHKNWVYNLFQRGQNPQETDWHSDQQTIYDTEILNRMQIDQARKDMTEAGFNQEMLCKFLEGTGSVFRHVDLVLNAIPQVPDPAARYVMGVDLAKQRDWTVVVVYDTKTNRQVYQDRWQQLEWPFQRAKIKSVARTYNNAQVILDATGLGDPISDDLQREGLSVTPFKITNVSKKDLIEKLVIWIEERKIAMIDTRETRAEFDNYSYDVTISGNTTYNAPQGFHDDIVIAHALAVQALQPLYDDVTTEELTPIAKLLRGYGEQTTEDIRMNEWANLEELG